MIQMWDYCPSCHEVVRDNDNNSMVFGNVPFHRSCLRELHKRAITTSRKISLIYDSNICIGVELITERAPIQTVAHQGA